MQPPAPHRRPRGTRHGCVSSREEAECTASRTARGAGRVRVARAGRRCFGGVGCDWIGWLAVLLLGASPALRSSAAELGAPPDERPAEQHTEAEPLAEARPAKTAEASLDLDRLRKRATTAQARADSSGEASATREAVLAWIRVSEALQSQGEYRGALAPLDRARALVAAHPDALADATVEAAMGNLWLVLASAEDAERVLAEALSKARAVRAAALVAAVLVNLGNARVMRADQSTPPENGKLLRSAFEAYQEADRTLAKGSDRLAQARARASAARVAVDLEGEDAEALWRSAEALVPEVEASDERAALLLHGATTLQLAQMRTPDPADASRAAPRAADRQASGQAARLRRHALLSRALALAESAGDDRLIGYSLLELAVPRGQLGLASLQARFSLCFGLSIVLLAETQSLDEVAVSFDVVSLEVVEQPSSLTDELEQPSPRVKILLVALEMFRKVPNSLA